VGVLDVPFAPFGGLSTGFEIQEWGAHDRLVGRVMVSPADVAERVRRDFPRHPFDDDLAEPPTEPSGVAGFLDESIAGIRLRGDLTQELLTQVRPDVTLVVFPEPHHAGHFSWHTVEPQLDLYADLPPLAPGDRTLADLYRELDRQIGRLVEAASPDTTVLVFALHGMEPARGVPTLLEPFLEQLDMSHVDRSDDRRGSALAALKDRIPEPLRNLYRRSVPLARRSRWGRGSVLQPYDWSRTRAFALPIDHEGHIRINLAGREAQGIVAPEDYEKTCRLIEDALRALTTVDGRPVVEDVLRPAQGTVPNALPDLVVLWHQAAFEAPVRIGDVETRQIRREETGQHSPFGFCISTGPAAPAGDEPLPAEHLHRLIMGALGR